MLTLTTAIVCSLAAFAGGFLDAIAGGGALLTIPALLVTGVPPHFALGTNKIGACMGTIVSLINFSRHGLVAWKLVIYGFIFSLIGSWLGTLLALHLDSEVLGKIMVALLPIIMLITLLPQKTHQKDCDMPTGLRFWLVLPLVCLVIGVYDGFFGPATGTFLILLLHWALGLKLITASGTAKAFNLASNASATISFMWHGVILWKLGLLMGACFMLGNWLGSAFAIHKGSQVVRKFLLISMCLLMATLAWQYFFKPAAP